jgi:hypothetical protein
LLLYQRGQARRGPFTMREFMEYVQGAFYHATGWGRDNSYSTLNSTADGTVLLPLRDLMSFEYACTLRLKIAQKC